MPVYFIRAGYGGPVKIGHAAKPEGRLLALQANHWEPLHIVRQIPGGRREELWLHDRFAALLIAREWFHWSDMMMTANPNENPQIVEAGALVDRTIADQRELVRAISDEAGLPITHVARRIGVCHSTLLRFMQDDWPYALSARTVAKLQAFRVGRAGASA